MQSNPSTGLVRSWRPQISRQLALESGKVLSLRQGPILRRWGHPRDKLCPEGLCQWKITITASGIKLTTFRFVPQITAPHRIRIIWMYRSKFEVFCTWNKVRCITAADDKIQNSHQILGKAVPTLQTCSIFLVIRFFINMGNLAVSK
jgi:hypothetical protein